MSDDPKKMVNRQYSILDVKIEKSEHGEMLFTIPESVLREFVSMPIGDLRDLAGVEAPTKTTVINPVTLKEKTIKSHEDPAEILCMAIRRQLEKLNAKRNAEAAH